MKYKFIIIALLIVTLVIMTGCNQQPIADRRGEMLFLESEELTPGFYIRNADDTFSPVMSGVSGYAGKSLETSPTRYLWYSHSEYDLSALIPKLTPDSQLVAVFDKTKNLPEIIALEKYEKKGSTIGLKFYISETDGTIYFKTGSGEYCPKSQAGNGISGSGLPTEVTLYEFNESPAIPKGIIDKNLNMIMGLEENGTYQIGFFEGTRYISKAVLADTYVYQSSKMYTLNKPYQILKDGYFVVRMPIDAEDGYYFVNNFGLFYYEH